MNNPKRLAIKMKKDLRGILSELVYKTENELSVSRVEKLIDGAVVDVASVFYKELENCG